MKSKLFTLLALTGSLYSFGQQAPHTRKCITAIEHEQYLQQQNPNRKAEREAYEMQAKKWIEKNQNSTQKTQTTITIPVVVHVVYSNATENVSDAQVTSAMAVLNADFTRTNADASTTPAAFVPVAGSPDINWCLAQVDPSGNPTTGIIHKSTTITAGFGTNDEVKHASSGGDDAWPTDKYFNIWVCKFSDASLLGYGEFPTASQTNTYGFVAGYLCYGTMGTAQAPFDKGRTATHEIGHCFNLSHIWGDANCGNDNVSDTPTQQSENFNCPTYPHVTCTNGPNGDMFMNYMDYTDDACMNTFTIGQSARMLAVMNTGPYSNLKNSTVCGTPIPAGANDAGALNISSPSGTVCANSISPVITLKNYGTAALTTVTILFNIDGGTNQTYSWTGNLATGATAAVNLPAIAVSNGSHVLNVLTSNPNGATDALATNDATSATLTIVAGGSATPIVQDFETATAWPYPGYTVNNPDAGITWALASVGHSGSKAIYMQNFNYDQNGQVDEVLLPAVDMSGATGTASFNFWLAYQTYTDPSTAGNSWDTLNILASTDCGATWTSVYQKYGSTLVTATPQFSTNEYTAPAAGDWRQETIDVSSFIGQGSVMFKINHITNYENDMYIDDINVDFTVGIAGVKAANVFKLFPNPSNGKVTVNFVQPTADKASINILNVLGEKVMAQNITSSVLTTEVDISTLNNGVYFIELLNNGKTTVQRIVLNK